MPGPNHGTPRRSGDRPDPNGNPRKKNRKQAKRLASRLVNHTGGKSGDGLLDHVPGSQNRKK